MASSCHFLPEEQFQCSICLDIFTDPVSTACGHNFCMNCIGKYWDNSEVCQCPLCKETFYRRPVLRVNKSFAEVIEHFRESKDSNYEELSANPGEVPCDFCTGRKLKAVKSCLVCLTSYCSVHIKPHYNVVKLTKHRLIDPVCNLEDRLCENHERLLELFCKTDQTCICHFCTELDHKTHNAVPLEKECREKKVELGRIEAEVQQMIQDRLMKVEYIKQELDFSKHYAQKEIEDSVWIFTALVSCIERSQAELIKLIEDKQRAAERRAEETITELEQEITELKKRSTKLKQLSHSEDHLHFLQSFPSLCSPPHLKDWSDITVPSDLCLGAVRRAMCQLEETVRAEVNKLSEREFERVCKYAVDVTLDPNTAHPWLILSEDGKHVRDGDTRQNLPDNPERFSSCVCVLGKDGFTSGRHYWEVEVGEKTKWDLGVARETIKRKGQITLNPQNGYWTLRLRKGNEYEALAGPSVLLPLRKKPRKVGVYVDYEEGVLSFYNVEAKAHIYTFTDTFIEKLYPYFSPGLRQGGTNTVPLIISPPNHTH
uniref:E3 ubiquitin-protein ligase TRIM39-like n=1 Tax=Lepisosteus oculatus TaxID=7918 RepID=W5MUQ4_LEPOC|nr:PREDICTED: E3 ubiquitin-protein ligase TRIM39-like [Lepisosteus oculatus]